MQFKKEIFTKVYVFFEANGTSTDDCGPVNGMINSGYCLVCQQDKTSLWPVKFPQNVANCLFSINVSNEFL